MALFCPISGHLLNERSLAEIWVYEHPGEEFHLDKMWLKPASLGPVFFQRTSRKRSTMQFFCTCILSEDTVWARSLIKQMQLAPKHSIFKHFHFNLNVHKIAPLSQITGSCKVSVRTRTHRHTQLQAQKRYVSKMHSRSGVERPLLIFRKQSV